MKWVTDTELYTTKRVLMDNILCSLVDIKPRVSKPREFGITSVIDTGLGINMLSDMLNVSSNYIDIVKFGFGTAITIPSKVLTEKIELLHAHNCSVVFGGTLFELVEQHGNFKTYLEYCRHLGIDTIEISDGAIEMEYSRKIDCIKQAVDYGYRVLSEVGNKDPLLDAEIRIDDRINMIKKELNAGSWKVIVEARESGTVGLFNGSGEIDMNDFIKLTESLSINDLIFEAPLKHQQIWFIKQLGNQVNLGNISAYDVTSLECLRQKLRADTL